MIPCLHTLRDGLIDFGEFVDFVNHLMASAQTPEDLHQALQMLGGDDEVSVDPRHLKAFAEAADTKLSDSEIKAMMDEAEVEGMSDIDHKEILNMVKHASA